MEVVEKTAIGEGELSESCIRLEVETAGELCLRLFVPHPNKREVELPFRGDIAERLLHAFSHATIPHYLVDIFENSSVCIFHRGCVRLLWDGEIRLLRPSLRTLFIDEYLIGESVPPAARLAAENDFWKRVTPITRPAFWSPYEREAREFIARHGWKANKVKSEKNEQEVRKLKLLSVFAGRARRRLALPSFEAGRRRAQTADCPDRPSTSAAYSAATTCVTPLQIAERRWKENEKINDKRYDGVLFKNVPGGQEGVSSWEVKLFRDPGYRCWGQMSVTGSVLGRCETAEFPLGTEPQLATYIAHTVGLFLSRDSDPALTYRHSRSEILRDL